MGFNNLAGLSVGNKHPNQLPSQTNDTLAPLSVQTATASRARRPPSPWSLPSGRDMLSQAVGIQKEETGEETAVSGVRLNGKLAGCLVGVLLGGLGAAQPEPVSPRIRPFPLKHVRLLEGPCKEHQERTRRYLHELEPDRLLHTFRQNAKLPSRAEPLGGWEGPDCEVRGHFVGHYLSACALMYASTGDDTLKTRSQYMVAELAKCQAALGPTGYLSAFPESFFDRLEAGKPVWAPYYTLHKIMAGLLDVHLHCGDRLALEVLRRKAAWVKKRTDPLAPEHMQRVLENEFGGMAEVLANLYAVTGDPEHLALARRFDHRRVFAPLEQGRDELRGLHANTNIPKMIGCARLFELTGQKSYHDIAANFWRLVVEGRTYCTGGTSNYEHWRSEPGKLAAELSPTTQECCCTYNMLKLTRHLLTWTADATLGDYYERAFWNGILGTQHPETGMMMYYVPLASGYSKVFNTPRDSFWCCTGTGVESSAKLGDSIYFHDDEGLWVNLFVASELHWPEKQLRVRQQTRFPEEQATALVVGTPQPIEFSMCVRVPYWATSGVKAKLNGQTMDVEGRPGRFLTIRRIWRDGDRLEIDMPMSLHAHPMPDQKTLVAFLYGPLVLAGLLDPAEMPTARLHQSEPVAHVRPVAAPYFVVESDDWNRWIKPVPGKPLCFRTEGQSHSIQFVPWYRVVGERYGVYWDVFRRGSAEHRRRVEQEEARQRRMARCVDSVEVGEPDSEKQHGLEGERMAAGPFGGRVWRHATGGGWFSYRLKSLPDRPMTLVCQYWGSDVPPRTFDILIDGTPVATQSLDRNKPNEFFEVEYPIPEQLTRGKQHVVVRFQARPGNTAGGVFGLWLLRD